MRYVVSFCVVMCALYACKEIGSPEAESASAICPPCTCSPCACPTCECPSTLPAVTKALQWAKIAAFFTESFPLSCSATVEGAIVCSSTVPGFCRRVQDSTPTPGTPAGANVIKQGRDIFGPIGITRWTCDNLVFYPN
jgi:hypothetical protein